MQGDFRSFERNARGPDFTLQIAIGVCAGILASTVITWAATELRLRWEIEQVTQVMRSAAEKASREIEQSRQNELARIAVDEKQRVRDRQAAAERQRAVDDAKRQAFDEAERKEAAWVRYYKPSPRCVGTALSVECSNEFIRAKRAFESQYRPGNP